MTRITPIQPVDLAPDSITDLRSAAYRRGVEDARSNPRAQCPYDSPALFGMWINGFTNETSDMAQRERAA